MSDNLKFEFYVLNMDINKGKVVPYNIFNNVRVQEYTEKAVKKYLRSPKNFKYTPLNPNDKIMCGFEALVKTIDGIIRWQEWGRYEYEIMVGGLSENNLEKWDCYQQAAPNMIAITHEVIRQYKEQLKARRINERKNY